MQQEYLFIQIFYADKEFSESESDAIVKEKS